MAKRRMMLATVKVPFLVRASLDDELATLATGGMLPRLRASDSGLEMVELAATGIEAVASVAHYEDVANLACAYFSGADRLQLALRAAEHVHAVPVEILHVLARSAADPETRYNALKVVGQAHADPVPGTGWNGEIELTLSTAMCDEEPAIRLEAALVSVRVAPERALPLLRELDARERLTEIRVELAALMRDLGNVTAEAPVISESQRAPRLAFPLRIAPGDVGLREALAASGTKSDLGDLESYEERAAPPLEARQRVLLDAARGAACAFFEGSDAALLALAAAERMHFILPELTLASVRAGGPTEPRIASIWTLAMAASQRVLADGGVAAHALVSLLDELAADVDLRVRATAAAARELVAAELR